MWLITPIGFFSIVQKSTDVASNTLTIRARVKGDLEALKATVLPGLGGITESKSTDYRYRAAAPRPLVEAAMAKLVATLDYGNFKNQVAKVQGSKRAKLYHDVWDVLFRMQGDPSYASATDAAPAAKAAAIPKADAYGGVLFDEQGRTLLREPAGHFGGYVWTFAKGKPDHGESPEQTALLEVMEETGYAARIVGVLPRAFAGSTSSTVFFLMLADGEPSAFGVETASTRWVDPKEARGLIELTTIAAGRARDLQILSEAVAAFLRLAR